MSLGHWSVSVGAAAALAAAGTARSQSPPAPQFRATAGTVSLGAHWVSPTVALADVNADGWPDVIVSAYGTHAPGDGRHFAVMLSRGDGTFSPPAIMTTPTVVALPYAALAVGDFDEDGSADVVTSCQFPAGGGVYPNISVLFGRPGGILVNQADLFASPLSGAANAVQSRAVAVGDVTGDRHLDIVTTTSDARLSVLIGDGQGRFRGPVVSGSTVTYDVLLLGDVNGDGKLDAVTLADSGSPTEADTIVEVNLGKGDGTFRYAKTTHVPVRLVASGGVQPFAALRPMDADRLADLVVFGDEGLETGDGGLVVLHSDGSGGFQPYFQESREEDGYRTMTVVVADVDGDHALDIVKIPAPGMGNGEVLVNDGAAAFPRRAPFPGTGAVVRAAAAASVSGTGLADVVLVTVAADPTSEEPSLVVCLENATAAPCQGDLNGDGVVDGADMSMFVGLWWDDVASSGREGDFNGDGVVDGADVVAFIQTWFEALSAGCR